MKLAIISRDGSRARVGQATLSLVFLIGGIIIMVGVSMAFLVTSFINSGSGYQAANQALAAASAGLDDALIQLNRNKDFENIAGYSVPVGNIVVQVAVVQNSPAGGQVTITADATVNQRRRKIQAVAAVNSSTGQVDMISWQQVVL